MTDTIFAQASAPGKAGVAVIRISGPEVQQVLEALGAGDTPPRQACLRRLRDVDGSILDEALVLRFSAGASFTGEDVAELQVHGSIAVVRAVLRRLGGLGFCRLAEPGEFTRRALLNDRLDLTEVQGLADIIEAETEGQRRAAMRVLSGEMSARISGWRNDIIRAMALLEATIDFADEEVPEDVSPEVRFLVERLVSEFAEELAGVSAAQSLRSGFEVALIGLPNSGKSSLINYLTRSEVAIVSPRAGTTRDVLERAVDIKGLRVVLIDTAGLREAEDDVEAIGVERAIVRAERADLRVFLHDAPTMGEVLVKQRAGDLVRRTKVDVHGGNGLSVVSGEGVSELIEEIGETLLARVEAAGFVSRQRDEAALREAESRLRSVLSCGFSGPDELIVEELRLAARALHVIIGGVDMEAVLDEIFSSFCLGK